MPTRRVEPPPELTTTSYAILGLLAIQPWTTYELAQQMQRSLRNFWPRAESRIYEEPKRLVRHGLAMAAAQQVGRRPRTVYSITAAGRRALRSWLAEPGGPPQLECDALVKVFMAEFATKGDVLGRIEDLRVWAQSKQAEHTRVARDIVEGAAPFPDRLPQLTVVGRLLSDVADAVAEWADWAAQAVEAWPDDPTEREPDWAVLKNMAGRRTPDASTRGSRREATAPGR